jgi:DNA-binding NarL/FixJ family response regulator
VSKLVAAGLTNIQIAKKLGTSRHTVIRQVMTVCDKLNLEGPDGDPLRPGYRRIMLAIHLNQGEESELRKEVARLQKRLSKYEPA